MVILKMDPIALNVFKCFLFLIKKNYCRHYKNTGIYSKRKSEKNYNVKYHEYRDYIGVKTR